MTTLEKIKFILNPKFHSIEADLQPYRDLVVQINAYHANLQTLTDRELQSLSTDLKLKCRQGIALESILVEAFALVKEACIRKLNLQAYDVQLIGAIGLHNGKMVEMQTGEGKTLAAVFPVYLNALKEKGVHVLTFNDYLARRDANWMRPVYEFLGLTVASCTQELSMKAKIRAYHADVTYTTAKAVGFDYLRSFVAYEENEIPLRSFNFAIIDEADAALIDEARNPLILAGDLNQPELDFHHIADSVGQLKSAIDFVVDDGGTIVYLTEAGTQKLETVLGIDTFHCEENLPVYSAVNLALQARELVKKDIDYIVKNQSIKLVDEFTGRIVADRKWRNGLQTAIEAKEGLPIQSEGSILNAITLQDLIGKYPKVAGMTATAQASAEEFESFYGLRTLVIPPNLPCKRIDHPDLIFTSREAKFEALIKEVERIHRTGQPILIGTLNVKESEELADRLASNGIQCQVLNAKNDELEADIISWAGSLYAVTISTNMAGRGTDIKLGGPNQLEKDKILDLGGLYVIGTNRHESSRIDRQLRGRAGRQGDIGQSRFFISFEDELMVKYKIKGGHA